MSKWPFEPEEDDFGMAGKTLGTATNSVSYVLGQLLTSRPSVLICKVGSGPAPCGPPGLSVGANPA